MTTDTAITVRGLTHSYGEGDVLHGLDFAVSWGQITGYLGPNGAGKSTTLKVLSGLLEPSGGTAQLAGHAPTSLAARRQLGALRAGARTAG